MPASSLEAVLTKLIPLWFSYENLPPISQIGTITNSHQSFGISSFAHIDRTNYVNSDVNTLQPTAKKDGSSTSGSAASYLLRKPISQHLNFV